MLLGVTTGQDAAEPSGASGRRTAEDVGSASERISALGQLLAADNAGTAVVLQVTVNLTVASLTYLSATLIVLNNSAFEVNGVLLAVLPAPVLMLQLYQVVLASGVRRRVESTREIEARLVDIAGLAEEYAAYRIGSRATESATDPDVVRRVPGPGRRLAVVAAGLPYAGFYLLGLVYTGYVAWQLFDKEGLWPSLAVAIAYGLAWAFLVAVTLLRLLAPLPTHSRASYPDTAFHETRDSPSSLA